MSNFSGNVFNVFFPPKEGMGCFQDRVSLLGDPCWILIACYLKQLPNSKHTQQHQPRLWNKQRDLKLCSYSWNRTKTLPTWWGKIHFSNTKRYPEMAPPGWPQPISTLSAPSGSQARGSPPVTHPDRSKRRKKKVMPAWTRKAKTQTSQIAMNISLGNLGHEVIPVDSLSHYQGLGIPQEGKNSYWVDFWKDPPQCTRTQLRPESGHRLSAPESRYLDRNKVDLSSEPLKPWMDDQAST